MWTLARRRFSQTPYSNGFDKRYETVKAELRAIHGRDAINEKNKPRLKALALSRGEENSNVEEIKLRRPSWKRAGCRVKDLTTTALLALSRLKKKDNEDEALPPGLPMTDVTSESKNKTSLSSPVQMKEGLTSTQCRGIAVGLNDGGRSLRSISVKST